MEQVECSRTRVWRPGRPPQRAGAWAVPEGPWGSARNIVCPITPGGAVLGNGYILHLDTGMIMKDARFEDGNAR